MKRMRRAIHFDFHTMPGIYDFGERFDAAEFAETLSDAGVEYVNVFARCNEGFAYYPTKIGVQYPGLKGDMLGDTVRECHKRGIGVTAYMNASYDHEQAIRHREWTVRNPKINKSNDWVFDYFIDMCYLSSGYKQYMLDMIKEVRDNYDVDGYFIDCMGGNVCYCNDCIREMKKRGIDIDDEAAALQFSKDRRLEFCKEIKEIIGDDKHLFFNMMYTEVQGINTHIEIEGLPGGQGYDFFLPQVSYARNVEKDVLYMTARFQKSWADFGGFKSRAAMEYDIWDAFMNACDYSIGDHLHPAENPDPHVYKMIKEVYADAAKYERYTDKARYLPEVAVITASNCFINKSGRGAVRMLSELKYNFDILNEDMDFSPYEVIVLPDDIVLTEKLAAKIDAHIKAGKGVIASGESGLNPEKTDFALKAWGVKYDGKDPSNQPYFKMTDTTNEILGTLRWAMYDESIVMNAEKGTEILAEHIQPYFNRHLTRERGFFYTPPAASDGHAAITKCGKVYHIAFNIFKAYYTGAMLGHKEVVASMLRELIPEKLIRAEDLPRTSRATLTEKDGQTILHVKVDYPEKSGDTEVIQDHNSLPAGRVVSVKGEYKSVNLCPTEAPVEFKCVNGYTEITLPEILGYAMLVLRK